MRQWNSNQQSCTKLSSGRSKLHGNSSESRSTAQGARSTEQGGSSPQGGQEHLAEVHRPSVWNATLTGSEQKMAKKYRVWVSRYTNTDGLMATEWLSRVRRYSRKLGAYENGTFRA